MVRALAESPPRKMLRIALIDILLFALPFIVYGAYMYAVKGVHRAIFGRGRRSSGCSPQAAGSCSSSWRP